MYGSIAKENINDGNSKRTAAIQGTDAGFETSATFLLTTEEAEEQQQQQQQPQHPQCTSQRRKGTIGSGIINLSNTIVGAGMLGLPGAFGGTGYASGMILILVSAFFSAHGLVLLSKAAQKASNDNLPSSFYTLAHATVPSYTILIDLAVTLKCFGVATGYLITVSDCMVNALDHFLTEPYVVAEYQFLIGIVLSRRFWVIGATIAVLPLSFYRTMDELKKASALALVFVFFLAFGIIAYANGLADPCESIIDMDDQDHTCRGEIVAFSDAPTTVSKLPIFIFAFTCHQNIFPIVNELHNRTQERLNRIIFCSIGFTLLLFMVVALEGYSTFGSQVRGDILLNYPENANVTMLRICIAFMLSLHYPLQLDPSRRCITSLVKVVSGWRQRIPTSVLLESDQNNQDDRLFNTITVSFLLLSFGVAMVVDDLGVVLAMVGATGSTLVSYILPGLLYIKLQPEFDWTKGMAILQLVLGCLIVPIALYYVLVGTTRH